MGNGAVIEFPGNFGDVQLIIDDQLFYPLDLVGDDEMFDGGALYL